MCRVPVLHMVNPGLIPGFNLQVSQKLPGVIPEYIAKSKLRTLPKIKISPKVQKLKPQTKQDFILLFFLPLWLNHSSFTREWNPYSNYVSLTKVLQGFCPQWHNFIFQITEQSSMESRYGDCFIPPPVDGHFLLSLADNLLLRCSHSWGHSWGSWR